MRPFILVTLLGALLIACGGSETKRANLPNSSGAPGEIYLFMDSTQWKGKVGDAMDSLFNQEMEGLPREEGIFRMTWVDPLRLNFVLKQRRNIIFLVTLDQSHLGAQELRGMFTPESLQMMESDTSRYVLTMKDRYAKNQDVMFLFSKTEEGMLKKLKQHGPQLIDYFNKTERQRLTNSLFKAGTLKGATDWMKQNWNVEMQIPFGYKLVQNEKEFLWVRQINPKDDKDVFISITNYTSADQFKKENLIAYRNEVCKKYLYEDPDFPDSYLTTEVEIPYKPVTTSQTTLNGRYAVEMKGLWRTNNKSMGGPFHAFAIADEVTGKFYYIEGFTFSPGKSQREIMRELETILYTFNIGAAK